MTSNKRTDKMAQGDSDNRQANNETASPIAADIARGSCRFLARLGFCVLNEMTLNSGHRADIVALGQDGQIWIIEIKSGSADFRGDKKWPEYLVWCDRFYFAVAPDFPRALLPEDQGVIIADRYDGEIVSEGREERLAPARRKAMTLKFARLAAQRLQGKLDPDGIRSQG